MLTAINNQIFCETKDITGIKPATLKSKLARARSGEAKEWFNISNPNYNNTNSRRLIAVQHLPENFKNQILEKFQLGTQQLKDGLIKEQSNPNGDVINMVNTHTAHFVEITETFVIESITLYIDKNWNNYSAYYIECGIPSKNILKYARTCALVQLIWDKTENIVQTLDNKDYKRLRRTLVMNLSNAMSVQPLNIVVPPSEYRLTEWIHNTMQAFYLPNKSVYDIVTVKNLNNTNRQKFTDEQKTIVNALRIKGNAPTIISIYNQLLIIAKDKQWWTYGGEFKPIHISTLQDHFAENDNLLAAEREGNVKFINNYVPTITRSLPTLINAMWGIDGSPIDLLITNGVNARQRMNSIRVYDYASCRLIGLFIYEGKGEKGSDAINAIKDAIRYTGYAPKSLQFDAGPASAEMEMWCKHHHITTMPANKGLARAKLVENLIHHFNQITKSHPAWSGQNRTAQGRNSQVSEHGYKEAQKNADTFERTAQWITTEAREQWNNRPIGTLERQPCEKSPNQLWNEKESTTPKLSQMDLAIIAGHHFRIKLKIEGLTIQQNGYQHTYFPNILKQKGFEKGIEIFAKTPLFHHPESGKLSLYMTKAGDNEAYIYNKDIEKGGQYIDTWIIKPKVSMVASQEGDSELLAKFLAFQKAIKELAIHKIQEAETEQEQQNNNRPKQQQRIIGFYDKSELHEQEMNIDITTGEVLSEPTSEEKTYINPITGMELSINN